MHIYYYNIITMITQYRYIRYVIHRLWYSGVHVIVQNNKNHKTEKFVGLAERMKIVFIIIINVNYFGLAKEYLYP